MKKIGNFLIGMMSSLGVGQAMPDAVATASEVPADLITFIEALISLLTSLLSTFLVAWLKRKW